MGLKAIVGTPQGLAADVSKEGSDLSIFDIVGKSFRDDEIFSSCSNFHFEGSFYQAR